MRGEGRRGEERRGRFLDLPSLYRVVIFALEKPKDVTREDHRRQKHRHQVEETEVDESPEDHDRLCISKDELQMEMSLIESCLEVTMYHVGATPGDY